MHMLMICLTEIPGISEIAKNEKIEYFQIALTDWYLSVISVRRKYWPSTKKTRNEKLSEFLDFDDI